MKALTVAAVYDRRTFNLPFREEGFTQRRKDRNAEKKQVQLELTGLNGIYGKIQDAVFAFSVAAFA